MKNEWDDEWVEEYKGDRKGDVFLVLAVCFLIAFGLVTLTAL